MITFNRGDVAIAFDLSSLARPILLTLGCTGFALLLLLAVSQYVVASLTDERSLPAPHTLLRATKYLPYSAGLKARLSEAEMMIDLSEAESHALSAVNLSPSSYKFRLTLASVKERQGDFRAAELALREAVAIAPYHTGARSRLAKLLLEQGRLAESIAEFHSATAMDHSSLPAALDLIWRATRSDINAVESVTNDDPHARLILAHFLLKQDRAAEAARVFGQIKDRALLDSSEGATFLNNLMTNDHIKLAHDLWLRLVGSDDAPLIWNGSFEEDTFQNFTQFDWTIEPSEYVRVAFDPNTAHTGSRSLRIDFRGRDTTVLNNEIRQLLVLQPGARYRFQCYAKTEGLITTQGPRVVVTSVQASSSLAASAPIAEGTNDWQQLSVDFLVPQSGSAEVFPVLISIKRTPAFSYDDPTRGTVWFDDFTLQRVEAGR